jgi:hypothetical protein
MTFEDDTFRIIPKSIEVAQNLLNDWYTEIEYFVSFEPMSFKELTEDSLLNGSGKHKFVNMVMCAAADIEPYIEYDISVTHKEVFLEKYLPKKRKQVLLTKKTQEFEKKIFSNIGFDNGLDKTPDPLRKTIDYLAESHSNANKTLNLYKSASSSSTSTSTSTPANKDETHNTISIKTYQFKNDVVNIKVPKKFNKKSAKYSISYLDQQYSTNFMGNSESSDVTEIEPFGFYGFKNKGPYGMQSCSHYSSWMPFDEDYAVESLLYDNSQKEIMVFFNLKAMKTLVYEVGRFNQDDGAIDFIINTPKCGFVKLFKLTVTEKVLPKIKEMFHNKFYENIDNLNRDIDDLTKQIESIETKVKETGLVNCEKEIIFSYIENTYEILDDVNYKVKSSVLCNEIKPKLVYNYGNIQSFNIRLSNYLKEMGLQKKRYNDGFYYYGLKKKENKPEKEKKKETPQTEKA